MILEQKNFMKGADMNMEQRIETWINLLHAGIEDVLYQKGIEDAELEEQIVDEVLKHLFNV